MASLIVHGDQSGGNSAPLNRKLLCIPIMQPDPNSPDRNEHMPDDVFFEDRIHIAVRRIFEGSGADVPAQAPNVKVINLSIGDRDRPFSHTPSPWARLLDWLSYKYRILFCVSSGNYPEEIDVGIPHLDFAALTSDEKVQTTLRAIAQKLQSRRLLSPAESLNSITVGATHTDDAGAYQPMRRIDLLPNESMFSPAMRVGHGFRRSVKPEILFPGGRQLYREPVRITATSFQIDQTKVGPGQKVAWDSRQEGELSNFVSTRGTSNATALATRGAIRIHDMLVALREQQREAIPDNLMAVLMKTLLVHGARQADSAKVQIEAALKTPANSRTF